MASRIPSGVTGPESSPGASSTATAGPCGSRLQLVGARGGFGRRRLRFFLRTVVGRRAHHLGERPGKLVQRNGILVGCIRYFHLFATSCFMNFSPSLANCRSLWYIRRQILVAATILSRARPKASITIRLL